MGFPYGDYHLVQGNRVFLPTIGFLEFLQNSSTKARFVVVTRLAWEFIFFIARLLLPAFDDREWPLTFALISPPNFK
jgi:hypothetical protein